MAGRGSRFGDEYKLPKPLLPVNGVPMVIQAVHDLPTTRRKIFVTQQEHIDKYDADQIIRKHFPRAEILGINEVTAGQACTCELGMRHFGVKDDESILISACDHGLIYDPEIWVEYLHDTSIDVAVWTFTGHPTTKANPKHWAWLKVNENKQVEDVYCKYLPDGMDPSTTHVIVGTMFFRKAKYFYEALEKNRQMNFRTNGEFYVDNILNRNIEAGLNVKAFEIDQYICWGLPKDYESNK